MGALSELLFLSACLDQFLSLLLFLLYPLTILLASLLDLDPEFLIRDYPVVLRVGTGLYLLRLHEALFDQCLRDQPHTVLLVTLVLCPII